MSSYNGESVSDKEKPELVAFSENCHCVGNAVEADQTPARNNARALCSRFPINELVIGAQYFQLENVRCGKS